jgi:hypothetical protein
LTEAHILLESNDVPGKNADILTFGESYEKNMAKTRDDAFP